jgi:hypothetical protein
MASDEHTDVTFHARHRARASDAARRVLNELPFPFQARSASDALASASVAIFTR